MISSKKLKIFSGEISLNNMRSDLAVKWLSLISIKSEQVSKICSMVQRLSHPMHIFVDLSPKMYAKRKGGGGGGGDPVLASIVTQTNTVLHTVLTQMH